MRAKETEHEEPLDLGLFEMMMGMTPEEWETPDNPRHPSIFN